MIVGAGLAGLIAAQAWPQWDVHETSPAPTEVHKALLRFRSDAVGSLVGIPFRPVEVRKGIWNRGWQAPTIDQLNLYSDKVLNGRLESRSIRSLDPVVRYVAPEDLHERLLDMAGGRVKWSSPVAHTEAGGPLISTAPLDVMLRQLVLHDHNSGDPERSPLALTRLSRVEFLRRGIEVVRFRVDDCDVHQTVYFPWERHNLYRASITGDLMICEFVEAPPGAPRLGDWREELRGAFGISMGRMEKLEEGVQQYGKISPIAEDFRQALILELSGRFDVYPLGRFATWRNILLDDLVQDIRVIKRLLVAQSTTTYAARLAAAK